MYKKYRKNMINCDRTDHQCHIPQKKPNVLFNGLVEYMKVCSMLIFSNLKTASNWDYTIASRINHFLRETVLVA